MEGLPWWSNDEDCASNSGVGAYVPILVREPNSHMLYSSMPKTNKIKFSNTAFIKKKKWGDAEQLNPMRFAAAWSLSRVRLFETPWTVCSPPASSVRGIFQARILEWGAISFSRESSQPKEQTHVSCVSCIGRQILYHHVGSPSHIPSAQLLNPRGPYQQCWD